MPKQENFPTITENKETDSIEDLKEQGEQIKKSSAEGQKKLVEISIALWEKMKKENGYTSVVLVNPDYDHSELEEILKGGTKNIFIGTSREYDVKEMREYVSGRIKKLNLKSKDFTIAKLPEPQLWSQNEIDEIIKKSPKGKAGVIKVMGYTDPYEGFERNKVNSLSKCMLERGCVIEEDDRGGKGNRRIKTPLIMDRNIIIKEGQK
jgi:hypothetical protein